MINVGFVKSLGTGKIVARNIERIIKIEMIEEGEDQVLHRAPLQAIDIGKHANKLEKKEVEEKEIHLHKVILQILAQALLLLEGININNLVVIESKRKK